jgi:hypothetical protein
MAVSQVGVDYGPRQVINWGDPLEVREMALLDMLSATTRRRRTNVSTALRFDGGRTRPLVPAGTFARVTRNAVIREHLRRGELRFRVSEIVGDHVTFVRPVVVQTIRTELDLGGPSIDVQTAPALRLHGATLRASLA